ncbi:hypothetical protein GCM10027275_10700 [Rhabdobacter roseus]|uniref:Uncharacterized protein n=1 Tax=Rhabdobacter roseus TaxID=1655419 RepID=A0A840TTG9_9BACT|nr:hypothetical protein [Rhabdobacter roseus]
MNPSKTLTASVVISLGEVLSLTVGVPQLEAARIVGEAKGVVALLMESIVYLSSEGRGRNRLYPLPPDSHRGLSGWRGGGSRRG